jgi:hypothetical protein
MNNYEDEEYDFLENSLCKKCEYLISRVLIPNDPELFEVEEEVMGSLEEGEPLIIHQHTCMLLNMDLSYDVVECSKFRQAGLNGTIFKGKVPFRS